MNKSFIFLVLAVVAVFAVSGCTTPKEESTPAGAFVGGSSGLSMSFMQNAPPTELTECSGFSIGVQLENKGEYSVPANAASVTLSGINTGTTGYDITPSSTQKTEALDGRQKFGKTTTPGGRDLLSFESIGSPNFPGDTTQTVIATACYPYQTVAMSTVCVAENFVKQTTGGSELCKVTGDKSIYNSGAPIQVTSVSQFPIGSSPIRGITVNLKLKDMGGGTPFTGTTCPSVPQTDIGKIKITKMRLINLDEISTNCKEGQKIITLTNGEGFVSCTFNFPTEKVENEFEDILEMNFDYSYTDSATTKVKFLNVPGPESDCAVARAATKTANASR